RPLPEDRRKTHSRRNRRPHHLLVPRPSKTPRKAGFSPLSSRQISRPPEMKTRLDELLVARGLVESRAQAKALIMSGRVLRGTERLDKPGKEFPADVELTIEHPPRFVSRGGEKLSG